MHVACCCANLLMKLTPSLSGNEGMEICVDYDFDNSVLTQTQLESERYYLQRLLQVYL